MSQNYGKKTCVLVFLSVDQSAFSYSESEYLLSSNVDTTQQLYIEIQNTKRPECVPIHSARL